MASTLRVSRSRVRRLRSLAEVLSLLWVPVLALGQDGFVAPPLTSAIRVGGESPSVLHDASGLSFPLRLGELTRVGADDYESQTPGMGFGYRYQGAGPALGVEAIIYVYNLRVKDIPKELNSPMLTQIRQLTRREITQQAESQSLFARQVFGNTLRMPGPTGNIEALFDGFTLNARAADPNSNQAPSESEDAVQRFRGYHFAALWTARNHFIKLKIVRSAQSGATPEMLGSFVQEVLVQTHRANATNPRLP